MPQINYRYRNRKMEQAMLEQALSIEDLAKAAGTHRNTILKMLRLESGSASRPLTIRKVCKILQKTPVSIGMAHEAPKDLENVE